MQTIWKSSGPIIVASDVKPSVREKTAPMTKIIHIRPRIQKKMPRPFRNVFILLSLCAKCFQDQPQRQNGGQAMEQVARHGLNVGNFAAENFRHHIGNSDKRD